MDITILENKAMILKAGSQWKCCTKRQMRGSIWPTVKMPLGTSTPILECLGLSPGSTPNPSCLLMDTLEAAGDG